MRAQMKVAVIVTPGILGFCITAIISAFVFHNHHRRIESVWFSTGGCGESLFIKQVILITKSVEFMPFTFWMAYGLLSHDLFLAAPNLLGCPSGFLQLVLYFKYRKREI
ncbi:bidirectional sugar transporter sweet3, partial [Quercus suber]